MTVDLLVIGAGLSGLMAAVSAANHGLRVKVIAKGMGALHWSAGTVDVLGYLPERASEPVDAPLARLSQLATTRPDHPYVRLGSKMLDTALQRFADLCNDLELPYAGSSRSGENLSLPSAIGAARPVYFAPSAQLSGDLSRTEPMLIVGFSGLRDFYPTLIAENLSKLGHSARAAFLPIQLISDRHDFNTIQLARALDNEKCVQRLAAGLRQVLESGERVGLPAILGLENHTAALAYLQKQVNAPIFEIPTLPPSVPGIRLTTALRRYLEQKGVRVEIGMEAIDFSVRQSPIPNPQSLTSVSTATSARPLEHRARHILLASGGLLGGGFDSDANGRVWETIFDLPLTTPQVRSDWFRPKFLDPAGQPVFQGGIAVNRHFQPVSDSGQPLFDNLWVCGGALAGTDPIRERSLEGVAISTAIAASQQIFSVPTQTT
ncbi:MAG: glycerol-3-phosphate dehydrogenase subunit GlpB [Chloroflexi bacterium]|nr:glycerol-3-phosphate dehydrogenase subunit GlpB [Chloroflexota bacterium]